MEIKLVRELNVIRTLGFASINDFEVLVRTSSDDLLAVAEDLLHAIISYVVTSKVKIKHGETFPFGYWLVKLCREGDILEVYEYNSEATEFIRGGTYTLQCWQSQHKVCDDHGANFLPPRPDKMVAISKGVYEGSIVDAVRYPSPEHMSGWWITTDQYDGDIKTLQVVHLYHLTSRRPDLMPLIALPYGYRFAGSIDTFNIWFDPKVV